MRFSFLTAIVLIGCAAAQASDFDGTWKGTSQRRDGTPMEMVYRLKVDGETLTGTIETPRGTINVENGKVQGAEITFDTIFGDNAVPHTGELADGKLTISVETPGGTREYTLTRSDDSAAPPEQAAAPAQTEDKLSGKWKANFKSPDGDEIDLTFEFKVDGDKVTGTVDGPGGQLPLENGKIEGDDFSFDTVFGDNTIGHKGKLGSDEITLHCNGFGNEWDLVIKRDTAK